MHSFDEAYAQLMSCCESSTVFMLTQRLKGRPGTLDALRTFDQIADYPAEMINNAEQREPIVSKLLAEALACSDGENL